MDRDIPIAASSVGRCLEERARACHFSATVCIGDLRQFGKHCNVANHGAGMMQAGKLDERDCRVQWPCVVHVTAITSRGVRFIGSGLLLDPR